ncbi:efflux RND transporter periplasmic adaptor subunit [uncultured Enterovirga sp.]|uniref:efflux RND transporter periplasmic adaptor subunit n=1 Tax=uncultured Enterovirga sp. TaxID=2026352 RepID=UPI0035CAEEB8
MKPSVAAVLVAGAVAATLWSGLARAHEGHDHGAAPTSSAPIAPRASSVSGQFELVAIARGGVVSVYLDRFSSNEPVTDATIQAETPDGTVAAVLAPDGSYQLKAPWSARTGEYDLVFTVTTGGQTDVFPVSLDIHGSAETPAAASRTSWFTTPAFAEGLSRRIAGTDPWLYALFGFLAGALVMLMIRHRLGTVPALILIAVASLVSNTSGLAHEGHDHEQAATSSRVSPGARDLAQKQADGTVFVPKPTQRILTIRTEVTASSVHRRAVELPGRIIADPNASGFVQAANAGRLSAPPGGFPQLGATVRKGEVLAYVTPPVQTVDVSDMRQRQGELDQQIAIVARRVQRFEPLAKTGAITIVQLDESRLELQGLKDRREALDRIRQEPEALVAPVSGVIAEANAAAGIMAQTSLIVFQIIDPSRLWVEALSFEAVPRLQQATVRLSDGRSLELAFQGSGLADRNQSVPVRFAIKGDTRRLRVGQFVTVLASSDQQLEGISLPSASVVRGGNGQDLVYEHITPERFEPLEVRAEPLDGSRVLILNGLTVGKRIVSQGAELLNQVR